MRRTPLKLLKPFKLIKLWHKLPSTNPLRRFMVLSASHDHFSLNVFVHLLTGSPKTLVAFWGAGRITFRYLSYYPATCFAFASGLANIPAFTPYTLHKKIALQGDFSCTLQNISLPLLLYKEDDNIHEIYGTNKIKRFKINNI